MTRNYQTTLARARKVFPMRNLLAIVLSLGALSGAACSSLLEVETPGRVPESELDNPGISATMVAATIGEFECAFAQYVPSTGILAGEYIISGLTINSNIWGWRGVVELKGTAGSCPNTAGATGYGFYTPMQTARFLAEDWVGRIEAFPDAAVPTKASLLAQLGAYAGYSNLLLGEGMCSMAINEGPEITRAQVWARAEDWFNRAIAFATTANNTAIRNMALVGRARTRLNLGNTAGADADAAQVPAGFVRNSTYSTIDPRRENRVFNATGGGIRDLSVGQAYRNLTVGASPVADNRVRVTQNVAPLPPNGQDGVTPQWTQQKYTSKTSPIPIASYIEARLIMAEVEGGAAAITILNSLRTGAGLPVLTPAEEANASNPDPQLNTVILERRRWLFSEGQRYGDMLRLGIPFPTGFNHKNQTYGNLTCLPLPDVETINNPNFH